ncbi:MAG TPA: TolC family outer membrane protein [Geminicoccus sp.]|uniref:TolC family outer membrane protein n=1 Tax=Geminicoccus sp. TaxID=2024832 RepID=UPI002E30773A|nr:TolC family outer membrane protein [Geminicoccus sp.]HEX2526641.1 TolC family outer membrane protein [Geminicoccus sp.]
MRLKGLLVVTTAIVSLAMGTAEAQTLRESLASAYNTNPDLGAARAELRATDELVSQALSGYRPQVGAQASYDIIDLATSQGDATLDSSAVGLTVTQPLYRGGGLDANLRGSENTVRASRANLIATEQQVLYDAVQAYAGVWRDRSVVELAIANEKRLQRQLQATRDRFNVGEVARTDVAQAEARLSDAVASRVEAEGQLQNSIATFRRVVSLEPDHVDQPVKPSELPANEAQAQELAAANPNIASAQYTLAAARDDIDVAFSQILPQVDLRASTSYANEPSSNLEWQRDASIGVQVTVPLYQGGAEYSQVRQNKQIARQRDQQLLSTQRSVAENVTTAWETLQTNTANISSRQSSVRANRIALEGVEQEAQVGSRTVLDVLDAEQELFSSQVELVRAQANEVIAAYALLATVGQLTAERLDLDVERYDAEAYYKENRSRLFGLGDPLN